MNDEHATAYISAGPMTEDDALQNASSPAITKETKVGPHQRWCLPTSSMKYTLTQAL